MSRFSFHEGSLSKVPVRPIEIQVTPFVGRNQNQAQPSPQIRAKAKIKSKRVGISKLGFGDFFLKTEAGEKQGSGNRPGEELWKGDARKELFQESNRKFPAINRIYQAIDQNLVYPEVVSAKGRSGKVQLKIKVNGKDGRLESLETLQSEDRYLRVLANRAVRRAFREPISLGVASETIEIELNFYFRISEGEIQSWVLSQKKILSNELVFFRNRVHSKFRVEIGPFSTYLNPVPQVMIATASIDYGWFFEKAKNWINRNYRAPIDPLQELRDDPDF